MIDWQRTEEKLGYGIECLGISKPKVIVNCDKCGKESILTIRIKSKVKNNNISWHCQKCVSNRPDVRKKLSESTKKQHRIGKSKAPELTEEIKEKIRQKSLCFWHSDRSKELKLNYANKYSKLYKGDKRFVESSKKLWKNNEFRGKMVKSMAERGKVSSLALIFYSILSDLNIKYHREYDDKLDDPQCTIGYYTFDCVIPMKEQKT